jgi:nucleotide-binding universal stress UspA family protein
MGGHGYSGLRRWALGSTTDKVVHAAAKPVLVVHAAAQPVPDPALRCIMVPLDGSALARQALPLALKLAERAQAELFRMTALTPPLDEAPWSAQLRTEEAATLATVREHLLREADAFNGQGGGAQIPVAPLVALGFAAEAIVDAAVRHNVDLIVMAAHGYSGLRRWTLGSVADKVLHAASVPVLLVPQAARLAPEAAVAEAALA